MFLIRKALLTKVHIWNVTTTSSKNAKSDLEKKSRGLVYFSSTVLCALWCVHSITCVSALLDYHTVFYSKIKEAAIPVKISLKLKKKDHSWCGESSRASCQLTVMEGRARSKIEMSTCYNYACLRIPVLERLRGPVSDMWVTTPFHVLVVAMACGIP